MDSSQLEMCLEDAETKIKDKRKRAHITQAEVRRELEANQLTLLGDIHQDQESLSWFIMKREAELKKLEQSKEVKQERIDQMVKAAKSLICADEPEGAGASEDHMLPDALHSELALQNGE